MPYLAWKSFDYKDDGFAIFKAIKRQAAPFFLDSSLHKYGLGRYSFLGSEPFYVFKGQGKGVLKRLRELLERYKLNFSPKNFPFTGGAVGYFSYDWGLDLENMGLRRKEGLVLPKVFLGFYDLIIALDHLKKKLFIFSSGFPENTYLLAKKRAEHRLKQCISCLSKIEDNRYNLNLYLPKLNADVIARSAAEGGMTKQSLRDCFGLKPSQRRLRPSAFKNTHNLTSNFTKERYLQAIAKAKDYIKKGDIYQVNLSQRFSAETLLSSFDLYQKLRQVSPSDFSAYLDCGDFQIISSSPERFLNFDGKKVSTRPMKGTRPRGINPRADARHKRDLLQSPKDQAELLMIVDLLRNDLGRVCKYGSIKVSSMRALEAYSTVYQTIASIEGVLHPAHDRIDLLKACFPGGSITGCPKIRSMQIIEELEPTHRGIYTGSLGYLSFHNTLDLNILIRTILKKGDKIYFQTGGGIVADSQAENEYQETLSKAQGIFRALKSESA